MLKTGRGGCMSQARFACIGHACGNESVEDL